MDASATNVWAGSVRVPHGSPWGRPKADGWPDVDTRWGNPPTSHRGNPEGRREGRKALPTAPSPRRRHKPKIPDAWGDDRFILTNTARGVHRPMPSIRNPRLLAVGHI